MKTFDVNTEILIARFRCPICDELIEADLSDIIPLPDMAAETAGESEKNNDEMSVECEECGIIFRIEVFKNYYEGNVSITYHLGNKQKSIEDFELSEDEEDYYSPTSWDREPDETDEEYQDRMQDQEDFLEHFL